MIVGRVSQVAVTRLLDKIRIGGIIPDQFLLGASRQRGGSSTWMSTTTSTTRERAPLLLVFGSLADRMADILRSRPSLTARIAFAPPETIHAIAAFLHLAPEAAGSDTEVGDFIEQCDPRELLKKALPDCPARLYRALDRAGRFARERSYYTRLDAVCRSPFGAAFLDGDLNDTRLDFYEALSTMDPLIANLHGALPETRPVANAVDTLISIIRAYGAIGRCDLHLPKNAGTSAVLRRLLRGLYAVRAPDPPFSVPDPLRLVETIGELRDIGRRFGNCLAPITHFATKHWFNLADGSVIYLATDEPPLLIALRRVGPDLWHIEQVAGPQDAPPSVAFQRSMEQKLKDAGIRFVPVDPSYALSNLNCAVRRSRTRAGLDDVDLEDMPEDFDD